jgi:ribosomal protein S18 acetylase RimI-like enzyme
VQTPTIRPASDIGLRNARSDELDAVSRLLEDVYGEFRPYFPRGLWEAYLEEIVDVRSRIGVSEVIVGETAGRLVGTVGFYPEASRSALERWPAGWASIRTLAVLRDSRAKGVGEALTRECLRRARERGAIAVGLHTNPFMAAANRLYGRLGFRRAPELDIEIAEMFTGRPLPADQSWHAQAFMVDLEATRR